MPLLIFALLFVYFDDHSPEGQATIVINEVLSSNNQNFADEEGDFEDWIELFNHGSTDIRLWGYGLTDDEDDFYRWVFPDTSIAPGEFMIIWASGKDRSTPGEPLHASFRISREGEPLRLTDPGGAMADTVPPVNIPTDYSYGRKPDGSEHWAFFADPTPGRPNVSEGMERLPHSPQFSHAGGFYKEPFYLTLSLPENADADSDVIYYTTDGSVPGPDNGMQYRDAIRIENRKDEPNDFSMIPTNNYGTGHPYDENWKEPVGNVYKGTVIRAVSVAPDGKSPETVTRTFFVDPEFEQRYQLPVVSLATDREHFFSTEDGIYVNENFWNTGEAWERPVHFEFFETGGEPVLAQDSGVRIHGGTSRGRPIKSLRMYARRAYGESWFEHTLIPDAPVDRYKRFLLRNSGNDWDGTYFRDALMQHLIAHTGVETQYYRPVVVFLNGEYWGLHNIRMRYDHRYFETMHDLDREDLVLLEGNAEIKEGYAPDHSAYLELRELLDQGEVNNPRIWNIVEERIDLDNFRDYHIANIYFRNTDWPGNNIDFWRKRTDGLQEDVRPGHDGRWRWLLYDTDFGFNLNFDYVTGFVERAQHNTLQFAIEGSDDSWPNPRWSVQMLRGALRNHNFRNDFINRFADLLNTAFSEERVLEEINTMYDVLKPHMEEHIYRWLGPPSMHDWELEVESKRDFARQRPTAQREHIVSQFDLHGTMELTLDVNHLQGGHILVNSIGIKPGEAGVSGDPWPWRGIYFKDVPVSLKAVPAEGYIFKGWQGKAENEREISIRTFQDSVAYRAQFQRADVSSEHIAGTDDSPAAFSVTPPRPNPFNHSFFVSLHLSKTKSVRFTIYSIDGRRVGTFQDGNLQYGTHELHIDASGWATGVYIAIFEAGSERQAYPVTLIK